MFIFDFLHPHLLPHSIPVRDFRIIYFHKIARDHTTTTLYPYVGSSTRIMDLRTSVLCLDYFGLFWTISKIFYSFGYVAKYPYLKIGNTDKNGRLSHPNFISWEMPHLDTFGHFWTHSSVNPTRNQRGNVYGVLV
jgi:hypothetical protein